MSSARRTRRCFIEYLNADRDLVSTLQRSDMTPEQKDSMLEFTSKGLHSASETSGDKIWDILRAATEARDAKETPQQKAERKLREKQEADTEITEAEANRCSVHRTNMASEPWLPCTYQDGSVGAVANPNFDESWDTSKQ